MRNQTISNQEKRNYTIVNASHIGLDLNLNASHIGLDFIFIESI